MSECVVCHQTLPEPEIALIFEDRTAISYVVDLLVKIAGDIAEAFHKDKLEAELSVTERELRFIVDSLAKAAGLEVYDQKDKEPGLPEQIENLAIWERQVPGPVMGTPPQAYENWANNPLRYTEMPANLRSEQEELAELSSRVLGLIRGMVEREVQAHTPCTPIPRDQWPK